MARFVREIMNRELLTLAPSEHADTAIRRLLAFDVTSAPVIEGDELVGIASLRDLFGRSVRGATVADRMTAPVVTIHQGEPIETAAHSMAANNVRRLVVVDERGKPVGLASALDVLSAMSGHPVSHPARFPHYDTLAGCTWSNDAPLDRERVASLAPEAPGIFLLTRMRPGACDEHVWVEAADNLRERLHDLLCHPPADKPQLACLLERPDELTFRTARIDDTDERARAIKSVVRRLHDELTRQGYFAA